MPLIFTPEYIVAIIVTLIAKRAGIHRGLLGLVSTAVIILTLWILGIHPLGFLVSWGGWIMFLATMLIGRCVHRIVMAMR